MDVRTLDTDDRRQVKQFLELPFRLYRDVPQWVPPLAGDARRLLDRRRNPFFKHSAADFFLARGADGQAVGRLAVIDHAGYNAYNHERTAFFYLFECENDPAAACALFEAAFAWARGRGLNKIAGPRGFTVFDGFGLLVKGFEHRPAFGLPYNLAYYPALVEGAGFHPAGDSLSGYLSGRMQFPERIHELSQRVQKRRGLRVERCATRADVQRIIPALQKLYNDSLGQMSGGAPLDDAEVKALADQMLWFANPRLIKIVVKEPDEPGQPDEPVGFLLAYPDVSAAVQRTRGRLFPLGWLRLLLELRRTPWVNVNGAGIVERYRGLGGTAILFSEMYKSVTAEGYEHADIVQIGSENDKMLREMSNFGIDFYKAHRVYERVISRQ
jgi:hypothetical protein